MKTGTLRVARLEVRAWAAVLLLFSWQLASGGASVPPGAGASDVPLSPGAAWELRTLGVDDATKLRQLRDFPKPRSVKLAIVGQGGVSREHLEPMLRAGNTLIYHDCGDPGGNTHDTQAARVILDLTIALGVSVELHVWQPGQSLADVAGRFRQAAEAADIVSFYQSFWGPDAGKIRAAIAESPAALFISPYVEHAGLPTSNTPQGSACKPWVAESIGHFVTAAPLARRSDGRLLTPADRGSTDSEVINFVAPSYYASGPGGTCPAGEVTTACAVYLYAAMPRKPKPGQVIGLLRATSKIDRALLASAGGFDRAAVDRLEKQVRQLLRTPSGKQRKLDAAGVLNLYGAFRGIAARSPGSN